MKSTLFLAEEWKQPANNPMSQYWFSSYIFRALKLLWSVGSLSYIYRLSLNAGFYIVCILTVFKCISIHSVLCANHKEIPFLQWLMRYQSGKINRRRNCTVSGSLTKEMSPSEKQQLRNDLSLYYSVPNLAGFRQEPAITEYLEMYTLNTWRSSMEFGGLMSYKAYIMKDVFDTLTSSTSEITVELSN